MDQLPDPTNHQSLWNRISTNALVRFLLFFASGWVFVSLLQYFEYVIFVFALSAILALLLNYPVRYLERFVKRSIALSLVIALSLIFIIVAVVTIALTLADQVQQLATLLLQTLNSANNPLDQLQNALVARNIPLNLDAIEAQIRNAFISSLNWTIQSLPILFQNYVTFIIVLVVAFFMLIDGAKLWQLMLKLVPAQHRSRVATAVQRNFVGFLRGQLLVSFLLSVATFLVFVLFQIPFSFLLAVTVGVFDLIPGIGATLGVSLVCLVILVQSGWLTALKVLAVCVILQQLQDNFISPRIMQSTVHLSPVVVFFALLVGTRVSGPLGIFLSVPIAGVIVSLLHLEEAQGD
ncbi:AI-2E family transporter [Leptolyngbya sp. FACHB-17]|uniref:AI-2E family transporter n=1 Tax=unclassified Leptolyngbya TaxID=2650499 RepID=UPI001681AE3F|nr:AI-2E family transporter [Leptolyngbya sp. FACHB-17]MBD2079045.1 AI-2E family transporter [Leptolyngbya sp. FACHB-17]